MGEQPGHRGSEGGNRSRSQRRVKLYPFALSLSSFAASMDPPIEPSEWEVIIVGSGLPECLIARCVLYMESMRSRSM